MKMPCEQTHKLLKALFLAHVSSAHSGSLLRAVVPRWLRSRRHVECVALYNYPHNPSSMIATSLRLYAAWNDDKYLSECYNNKAVDTLLDQKSFLVSLEIFISVLYWAKLGRCSLRIMIAAWYSIVCRLKTQLLSLITLSFLTHDIFLMTYHELFEFFNFFIWSFRFREEHFCSGFCHEKS